MAYNFDVNQQRIMVCKKFCMTWLDIKDRPIRAALA